MLLNMPFNKGLTFSNLNFVSSEGIAYVKVVEIIFK